MILPGQTSAKYNSSIIGLIFLVVQIFEAQEMHGLVDVTQMDYMQTHGHPPANNG